MSSPAFLWGPSSRCRRRLGYDVLIAPDDLPPSPGALQSRRGHTFQPDVGRDVVWRQQPLPPPTPAYHHSRHAPAFMILMRLKAGNADPGIWIPCKPLSHFLSAAVAARGSLSGLRNHPDVFLPTPLIFCLTAILLCRYYPGDNSAVPSPIGSGHAPRGRLQFVIHQFRRQNEHSNQQPYRPHPHHLGSGAGWRLPCLASSTRWGWGGGWTTGASSLPRFPLRRPSFP